MSESITPRGLARMTGILAFLANEDTHVNGGHSFD